MYVRGIVTEVRTADAHARVRLVDRDDMLTWWLACLQPKTHKDKAYWLPDVGEHVSCILDDHMEDGCILGAHYGTRDPVPVDSPDIAHVTFRDGAAVSYDRAAHTMAVTLPQGGTLTVTAPGGVTINADSGVTVNAAQGVTVNAAQGGTDVDGDLRVTGDIIGGGQVSDSRSSMQSMRGTFNAHTHPAPGTAPPTSKMT